MEPQSVPEVNSDKDLENSSSDIKENKLPVQTKDSQYDPVEKESVVAKDQILIVEKEKELYPSEEKCSIDKQISVENKCVSDPIIKLNFVIQDCKRLFFNSDSIKQIGKDKNEGIESVGTKNSSGIEAEQEPLVDDLEQKPLVTSSISQSSKKDKIAAVENWNINTGIKEGIEGIDCLHEAIRRSSLYFVKRLLARGADPDEPDWAGNGDPPILQAAARQSVLIVKALIDAGCDVNACSVRGETALHIAVCNRPINKLLVDTLLAAGCNPNTQDKVKGHTALHRITSFCEDELDIFLKLASVTNVNLKDNRQNTILHRLAATSSNALRLQQVLDLGAKPSLQNDRGETALSVALEHDWVEGAVALIHSGTDLHLSTLYCETALHIAARKNMPIVVAALFDHGAAVNACDLAGNTALHLAAGRGFNEVVKLLLSSPHVDLNAQNKEGATPLHIAVESGFITVVKMLVQAEKIDLEAETALALTALDLAKQGYRRRSQPEMFQMLTEELERRHAPHLT